MITAHKYLNVTLTTRVLDYHSVSSAEMTAVHLPVPEILLWHGTSVHNPKAEGGGALLFPSFSPLGGANPSKAENKRWSMRSSTNGVKKPTLYGYEKTQEWKPLTYTDTWHIYMQQKVRSLPAHGFSQIARIQDTLARKEVGGPRRGSSTSWDSFRGPIPPLPGIRHFHPGDSPVWLLGGIPFRLFPSSSVPAPGSPVFPVWLSFFPTLRFSQSGFPFSGFSRGPSRWFNVSIQCHYSPEPWTEGGGALLFPSLSPLMLSSTNGVKTDFRLRENSRMKVMAHTDTDTFIWKKARILPALFSYRVMVMSYVRH